MPIDDRPPPDTSPPDREPPDREPGNREPGARQSDQDTPPVTVGSDPTASRVSFAATHPAARAKRAPAPSATPADEVELVGRLQAGDEVAYEELVRTRAGRLLAVARRMSASEADAEDAVQEAFLSAFKAIGDFDGRSTLSTWLHRIVVNAALMRARKAQRSGAGRTRSIDELLPQFDAEGHHRSHQPRWTRPVTDEGGGGIQPEVRIALESALRQLPDEFRTVLILKDVEGLESRQIAASLGISDALVRQRVHRGRQALMKLMAPVMQSATAGGEGAD